MVECIFSTCRKHAHLNYEPKPNTRDRGAIYGHDNYDMQFSVPPSFSPTNNPTFTPTSEPSTKPTLALSGDSALVCNNANLKSFLGVSSFCISRTKLCSGSFTCDDSGIYITSINLASKSLSSTIPTEMALLTQLASLDLHDNQLTGSIPTEIGVMNSLNDFRLYSNQLSGSITVS